MLKKIKVVLLLFFCSSIVYAENKKYSEENCKELYDAVGTFLYLADIEWKKKNEEGEKKGLNYSQAAANYSTVYDTFCK
tara:strand:+ start:522 stop:758 length:237 start_codon:yes stop_codon:yes gene_type:complete